MPYPTHCLRQRTDMVNDKVPCTNNSYYPSHFPIHISIHPAQPSLNKGKQPSRPKSERMAITSHDLQVLKSLLNPRMKFPLYRNTILRNGSHLKPIPLHVRTRTMHIGLHLSRITLIWHPNPSFAIRAASMLVSVRLRSVCPGIVRVLQIRRLAFLARHAAGNLLCGSFE